MYKMLCQNCGKVLIDEDFVIMSYDVFIGGETVMSVTCSLECAKQMQRNGVDRLREKIHRLENQHFDRIKVKELLEGE